MFETISETLNLFGRFSVAGFLFGFLYDWLRCLRIIFPSGRKRINIEDFIFVVFSSFIFFFIIVEYGSGKIRLYYITALIFGFFIYMFSLGFFTKYLAAFIGKIIYKLFSIIKKPIIWIYRLFQQILFKIFGALCQKISNNIKNLHFHLKKRPELVYNNSNSKIDGLCVKAGEKQHVIQAEIRKKA